MRRWSRGRLAAPESVAEMRGWERRASICVGGLVAVLLVVAWVLEEGCCWLGAVGCGGEGSAGGVRGCEGELAGGGRVAGEAMVYVCGSERERVEWGDEQALGSGEQTAFTESSWYKFAAVESKDRSGLRQ